MQLPALDRAAELREQIGLIDRLRADPASRVIVVRGGRVRLASAVGRVARTSADVLPTTRGEQQGIASDAAAEELFRDDPAAVGDAAWALLGRSPEGQPLLLAVPPAESAVDAAPDEVWLGLRDLGARLSGVEAELLVEALALAGWLRDAPFCPACGSGTELRQAGWSRRCLVCAREHFPRTDPAVIVAVQSADGERLLLGANANWGGRMHSCFAGFAEAGESLEQAAVREIEEEAGVRLAELRYSSSQAWPFPRSLMIGFHATVDDETAARPDGEEIIDVRWFTRAEIGAALAGAGPFGLPGPASIARALISDWYEGRA